MGVAGEIRGYLGTRRSVKLHRPFPSDPRLNGYIVAASDELVVVHAFHDFMPDGYSVVRARDIDRIESGPHERFWDTMLEGEGLLGGLETMPPIELGSMAEAVRSTMEQSAYLVVQCEDREEKIQDFYLGYVEAMGVGEILFRHFDAAGRWHEAPGCIDIDEITRLQLDTPYIRRFSKYVKPYR